jgi:hypothetical protein
VVWEHGTAVCVTVGWRQTHGGEFALVAGQARAPTEGQGLCHHVGVQCPMRACFVTPICVDHTCMCGVGVWDRCVRHGGVDPCCARRAQVHDKLVQVTGTLDPGDALGMAWRFQGIPCIHSDAEIVVG